MDAEVLQRGAVRSRTDSGDSPWVIHRWRFAPAIAAGVIVATGWSMLLSWASGLPRISPVSFAGASEKLNTPAIWVVTFTLTAFALLFVQALITLLVRALQRGSRKVVR